MSEEAVTPDLASSTRADASEPPILEVQDLKKHYPIKGFGLFRGAGAVVKAVDGISFDVARGETLGLVGESGCGKSTTGRAVMRLEEPTAGRIIFDGVDITALAAEPMRATRRQMQLVFQDSADSLNPRMSVGRIVGEPLQVYDVGSQKEISARVEELLVLVGLDPSWTKRFPHEFSGGQRQRINLARALALNPQLMVLDEPISALDVSIQAQVVNLLRDLQEQLGLTYLFVAHDLAMVRHISHRIAVMYLGKLVELADASTIFQDPLHPYTQALIAAVPVADPQQERERSHFVLEGEVPSPRDVPPGCVFNTRCPLAQDVCREVVPEYQEFRPGHWVACHFVDEAGGSKIPLAPPPTASKSS